MNLVQMPRSERPRLSITGVASTWRSESSADACSFPRARSLPERLRRFASLEHPARKRNAESQEWSGVLFGKMRVILVLSVIGLFRNKLPVNSAIQTVDDYA